MSIAIENLINKTVRYFNKPFWKATEYLLTSDPSWYGMIYKVGGLALAILTVPIAVLGETLHFFSYTSFQRPYLFLESSALPAQGQPQKFLTLNTCMMQGGLPIIFGGMRPASQRMKDLAAFLKEHNADIICLQEMAFDPSTQLIDHLKETYHYFYYRIGPNPYRMESALFWASKFPLIQEPQFIPFRILGMQGGIRRGFFIAELESSVVITTHLDPHMHRGDIRAQQIKAMMKYIEEQKIEKPIFLMGDLNIESGDTEAIELLKDYFPHFKPEDISYPAEENATCYDNCPQKPPRWTVFDHILIKNQKRQALIERALAFDLNNLSSALSDHHAVILTL